MGAFESLRYRDFRRVWWGAILSNIGTWMQMVALSWYVFELTRSPFWVGAVSFANFIPMWLSPLGGVLADRMDRRTILLVTQSSMMAGAVVLALLATLGLATLVPVLLVTLWAGLAFAFNSPSWHTFLPSLVPRDSMVNAIALNSAQFSLARVIGPAVAGFMLAEVGVAPLFWINAASFSTVLLALWFSPRAAVAVADTSPDRPRTLTHLRAGFSYAWGHRTIRAMIATIAVLSFFGSSIYALLPVYAEEIFDRGPRGFGALAAAMGTGSVIGALLLGGRGRVRPTVVGWSLLLTGAALGAFAAVPNFGAGLALILLFGGAYLFTISAANSEIQTSVDEAVRGRVMSLFMLAFGGLFPIGSLLAGALAEVVGAPAATMIGASVSLVAGFGLVWWSRRWSARPAPGPAEA